MGKTMHKDSLDQPLGIVEGMTGTGQSERQRGRMKCIHSSSYATIFAAGYKFEMRNI